jgi:hypothetical protein
MKSNQKRGHYRLEYPVSDRPSVLVNGHQYEVVDVSEQGMKFKCQNKITPDKDSPFKATVFFKDGKSFDVSGTILRYDAEQDQCVVQLTKGIPLAKMIEEQLLLIRKYKGQQ